MSLTRASHRLCGHLSLRGICTSQAKQQASKKLLATATVCTLCGVGLAAKYTLNHYQKPDRRSGLTKQLHAATTEVQSIEVDEEEENTPDVYRHARERRFYEFASVLVEGERYMTPQDFLESVTDEEPRPRVGLKKMSRNELKKLVKSTPGRKQASPNLFRKIHENGVISYSEYLFLLCILTKPKAGFKIAFKMFDTDRNERVDKHEFQVLEEIFRNKTEKSKVVRELASSDDDDGHRHQMAQIISGKEDHIQDTTLLVHFFGPRGNQVLSFDDFYQFMDNLQSEVLELEFLTYSRGMPTISEEDFARVVLRYTDVVDEEEYYRKLCARIPEEKGLTFDEFRSFFQFLNNLEDFAISINMYAMSGKAIGEDEFHRAVKVTTGQDLSRHLVHTLYQLFDKDGDGKLSYVEFIGVMKDRLHRGFRSHLVKHVGWAGFKKCVKYNIKMSST